jgi:outer membrane protein assembly factor BamB
MAMARNHYFVVSRVLVLFALFNGSVASARPWPQFRGNEANTGTTAFATQSGHTSSPHFFQTDGLVWGTAVTDGSGHIYVGSADKYFYSLNADGTARWRYRLSDSADSLIDSAAAYSESLGLVAVPGGDGFVHALDAETGQLRWRFRAYHSPDSTHQRGDVVNSFEGNVKLLGTDGFLAGSDNGTLYAINADGSERWHFTTGMMVWSSPAVSERWVAFGSLDGNLYVLDRNTGRELARFTASSSIKASPLLHNDALYFGDSDGRFYRLAVTTRSGRMTLQPVWTADLGAEIYSSAALAAGHVIVGALNGIVYSMDINTGVMTWRYDTTSRVSSSPLVLSSGEVLIGAKNGKLYALDQASGLRLWSYSAEQTGLKRNLDASPIVNGNGDVVVGSYSGRIHFIPSFYCPTHRDDSRCEFGGSQDTPHFGSSVPRDGLVLAAIDGDGDFIEHGQRFSVDIHDAVTLQLVSMSNGIWNRAARINPWNISVTSTPAQDVEVSISPDGHFINLRPANGFWAPSTTYTVTISGRAQTREGYLVWDRLTALPGVNYFTGTLFQDTVLFRTTHTENADEVVQRLISGQNQSFDADSLYIRQPEALDTYLPAAVDGQGFRATVFALNADATHIAALALPTTPNSSGPAALLQEPSKAFTLSGTRRGASVRLEGGFRLAAMGGDIGFERFLLTGRLTNEGPLVDAAFHAQASCLGIRGNASSFSFPQRLVNEVCDFRLAVIAEGTLETRVYPQAVIDAAQRSQAGLFSVVIADSNRVRFSQTILVQRAEIENRLSTILESAQQSARPRRGWSILVFWNGHQVLRTTVP